MPYPSSWDFEDTFNASSTQDPIDNWTPDTSGHSWLSCSGNSDNLIVDGTDKGVYHSGSGAFQYNGAFARLSTGTNYGWDDDHFAEATGGTASHVIDKACPAVRINENINGDPNGYCALHNGGNNWWVIQRRDAPLTFENIALALFDTTPSATDKAGLEVVGDSLQFYFNGSAEGDPVTNTVYANGSPGIIGRKTGTPTNLDNFKAAGAAVAAVSGIILGRLGLRGTSKDAKTSSGILFGRLAMRGSDAAAKTNSGRAIGRFGLRALIDAAALAQVVIGTVFGAMALRGIAVTAKTIASTNAGRIASRGTTAANKTASALARGSMAQRGITVANKIASAAARGSMALRGTIKAAIEGAVQGVIRGAMAIRGFSVSAKQAASQAAGRLATRGAGAGSKTATASATGRLGIRGFVTTALESVVNAVVRGMLALAGYADASKTASGAPVGRAAIRASDSAAKTADSQATGRAGIRGTDTAAKSANAQTSGKVAMRGFTAFTTAVVFFAQVYGRIALRSFSSYSANKQASIRAGIAIRAAAAANSIKAGAVEGKLAQRFVGAGLKTANGAAITHIPIRGYVAFVLGDLGTISRVVDLEARFDPRISLNAVFDPSIDLQAQGDPV